MQFTLGAIGGAPDGGGCEDEVSWGDFFARIFVSAFCVGWGALASYRSARYPDSSERFWPESLKGRARKVRISRRRKFLALWVIPVSFISAGAIVLIDALISLIGT
jgi:hypothetical protein